MADKPVSKPLPSAPISVVPTGDAYANLKDDHRRWLVTPTSLGGLKQGAKVGIIHMQPGTDIDRLVRNGALIPLAVDESIEAVFADEQPVVPAYPVVDLLPPKPVIERPEPNKIADAIKADDEKKAAEAKVAAEVKAKHDAEVKAKADADEKVKQDAIMKAKAEAAKAGDPEKK